jgi:outer membrane protein TolC
MADLFSSRMAPRFEEFTLGVTVGLPLLDGGERSAALRRARADKARLTAQEQDLALRVAAEVLAADARLTAARANLAAAQTGERAAGENYRLALARYEAGKSLHVEVLDALRMKVMAETSLQAARFDLASAADALRRAVGEPGAGER